ncbi:hypothetical protein D9M68_702570 [compost metagenome]
MPGSPRNNRTVGEVMFGLHKNFMFHVQGSFSDFGGKYEGESLGLYAKYRFLSADNEHSHFRGAAFGRISGSKPNRVTEDLNLEGDNSGWQSGVVFTQLLHKLALSATVAYGGSLGHGLRGGHFHGTPAIVPATTSGNHQTWSYSLSSGYLWFPVVYRNYKQPNFNLYFEALGQQNSLTGRAYLDLAPALQLILNSKTRIDLGYRFEVAGNMLNRHINDMVLTRVEFNFFNALTKK